MAQHHPDEDELPVVIKSGFQLTGSWRAPEDPEGGGFMWLLRNNEEAQRSARRQIAALTVAAVEAGGYSLGARGLSLRHAEDMALGTKLTSPSRGIWDDLKRNQSMGFGEKGSLYANGNDDNLSTNGTSSENITRVDVIQKTVFEVALDFARKGRQVVAVNAASAYHFGGGFLTGGRHALEESMCVQSSLFKSLRRGEALAQEAAVQVPDWVQPKRRPAKRADDGESIPESD